LSSNNRILLGFT